MHEKYIHPCFTLNGRNLVKTEPNPELRGQQAEQVSYTALAALLLVVAAAVVLRGPLRGAVLRSLLLAAVSFLSVILAWDKYNCCNTHHLKNCSNKEPIF